MATEGLIRSYGALLTGALVPIYCAAHASVQVPKSIKDKWKQAAGQGKQLEDEDEEDEEVERLTTEDAYLFPVLGSIVLFGLFLAFKYLDKNLLNRLLGGYLAIMGIGALGQTFRDVTKRVVGRERLQSADKYKFSLQKNKENLFSYSFTKLHVFAGIAALALTAAQQYTQHWILSNILALSFAYSAISLFYLDSFATASILLGGLFLYDVWWVFGSKAVFGQGADVMVSVAKNFNAPIKIVFPKDLANAKDFTLLGLGDIVLPGSFLSLALRFDYHRATTRAISHATIPPRPTARYPKPYFHAAFVAYVAGLVTTIFVMHHFRAAQPALLYLSPACVGSVTLVALVRRESKEMWGWEDGEEERKAREKKEQDAADNNKKETKDAAAETGDKGAGEEERERERETAESTSIEVDGGRVLTSRSSRTD